MELSDMEVPYKYTLKFEPAETQSHAGFKQSYSFFKQVIFRFLLGQWLNGLNFLGWRIFSRENKPFKRFFFQGPGRLSEGSMFIFQGCTASKPSTQRWRLDDETVTDVEAEKAAEAGEGVACIKNWIGNIYT